MRQKERSIAPTGRRLVALVILFTITICICEAWVQQQPIVVHSNAAAAAAAAAARQRVQQPQPYIASSSCFSLYMARTQADMDVVFGSKTVNESGVSWGEDDSDEMARQAQRAKVQEILAAQDLDFKQARKSAKWGLYANATTKEDFQKVLDQERLQIEQDFQRKQLLAAAQGVQFEVLSPRDDAAWEDETGNVQITAGSRQGGSGGSMSWFAETDEELRAEWEELTAEDPDHDAKQSKLMSFSPAQNMDIVQEKGTGKLIARDALAGVRVGSAGGWTLEVFPGDFVVHRKFGIGRFEKTCLRPKTKLSKAEKEAQDKRRAEILTEELRKRKSVTSADIQAIRSKFGTDEDLDPISNPQTTVLELTYHDAVVHVPVDRAYRLSRYRAGDAVIKPKLSRVKGEAWSKTKRKVEENTLALAEDVLALYATRETLQRQPFNPVNEDKVKEFEKTFKFEPTSDQKKCFEDVESDMVWRSRPMDRLVCGDVGFGKTEVALRALFRAVVNGKQCALLAPTGVLAAQHYKNVMKRMGPDTPFNVTCSLLRGGMGRNTKSGREMREEIASGAVQLIVGTHALLSNDLQFKDLGLLVVDEEQRFGVKQKERLKLISSGVDVLTLSATPIPRTLQMSLSGIRDTSTIRSPPPMRKPTITYVQDFSEKMVQTAIQNELDRGGQCYYVVPRISMLDEAEDILNRLFPSIRIIQAHGRMHRNGAEENVALFAEGGYDVLLATTVIENGVDIPTVNTIIVQNSQAFGMSTLYQLRGRVGRSDVQAYAYFLHREESVTEQAAMRLQAIGELNELGSGFDVANRDLEIRGAGSLLGTEQSGLASKVGFDLYMRMLKKSIRKLRGFDLPLVPRTNVLLPFKESASTFTIPKTLIPDEKVRRTEESKARLAESSEKLVNLTNTWKQEYGALPASLQKQLKVLHLNACFRRLGIDLVGTVDSGSDITLEDGSTVPRIDCILRSPGLRPRHWGAILSFLPRPAAPKGLDVVFPARFTLSGDEEEVPGGRIIDLKTLLLDESRIDEKEEEEWDALDDEEIEAMKEISSAVNVKAMDEIDLEQYPRFVIKNFLADDGKAVDHLLKVMLPIAKIVYEKQEEQAANAKAAAALRDRQENMRSRKKEMETVEANRMGYNY